MPMKLVTNAIENKLLENGRNRDQDHAPVLKIFNPSGAATWLFSEMDDDGDTLFGLADLGFGCVELGYSSLDEMRAVRLPSGLALERDLHFEGKYPMSVYVRAANAADRIVDQGPELERAANLQPEEDDETVAEFDAA